MCNTYKAIGIMSGTSLDGLDLAFVQLNPSGAFKILKAATYSYPLPWAGSLHGATQLSAPELIQLNSRYGRYLGEQCLAFIETEGIMKDDVDFIASHGHTVFHAPAAGYTYQIGNGPEINQTTGITTVNDFRTADVALGGQGAPLVPVGDRDLFSQYDACLNLGGFANISLTRNQHRLAFDICPVNITLNPIAQKLGHRYDEGGSLAASGQAHTKLLSTLNALPYYLSAPPKSLGIEWVQDQVTPLMASAKAHEIDALATLTVHAAQQISRTLKEYQVKKLLVTGGGAYNRYLIQLLEKEFTGQIQIPNPTLIEFKEALVFAWLGLLRILNKKNVLASVTGARIDHSAGILWP